MLGEKILLEMKKPEGWPVNAKECGLENIYTSLKKYSINDLLIGHVSIVGIYKGIVNEEFITMNTFTYFQDAGAGKEKQDVNASEIIKSSTQEVPRNIESKKDGKEYHFVDTLAIIQDVAFNLEEKPAPKLHWWNRFGIWLSKLWRE